MKSDRIKLDEINRNLPYTVPEGYFDKLPSTILERIPSSTKPAPLISWSWKRSMALASALVLLVALVWSTFPLRQGDIGRDTLADVSDTAIVDYLQTQELDFYDLAEHKTIQASFDTDSAAVHYLKGVDQDAIRELLNENSSGLEIVI